MGVTESMRRLWVITSLTLRYLLGTRRVIAMLFLSAIPFILALSLAAARVTAFNSDLFQVLMIPLFLQVVLIFVTLVNATALIREEIDDNTLPYLLTRPISDEGDRKSTRLNSSHLVISYAVFCLKKK